MLERVSHLASPVAQAVLAALACEACGAQSESAPLQRFEQDAAAYDVAGRDTSSQAALVTSAEHARVNALNRGDTAPSVSAGEAVCPAEDVEKPAPKPGSSLWLQSYGDLAISSVAGDRASNVLVSRAGLQTVKLSSTGAVLWSKPFGSLVATDESGNVYVAGTLETPLAVDQTVLEAHAGGRDAFVVKLEPAGKVLYATALGGSEDDEVQSIAADSFGNVVVSGRGLGTVKLAATGSVSWTKSFFGEVALDSTGSTVVTGGFAAAQDFGGGALQSRGGADVFVVKLAPDGQHVFSRSFGDVGELQQAQAIAIDRGDNLIIAGVFDGSLDFGAGPLVLAAGACPAEAWCKTSGFVAKLDAAGHALWSKSRGPMRELSGVATDSQDNVIVSGALPGGVTPFRQSFLSKLDGAGKELWRTAEWPATGIGAGHRVAVGVCDDLIWSVSVRPTREADETAYLARLAP